MKCHKDHVVQPQGPVLTVISSPFFGQTISSTALTVISSPFFGQTISTNNAADAVILESHTLVSYMTWEAMERNITQILELELGC
jgi:hypothetical protein